MKFLITGGCGFIGSNLAAEVLARGADLVLVDNLSRLGSNLNLEWLKRLGADKFYHADVRNQEDISYIFKTEKPDVIFHVAGQVAMTTSLIRPRLDFETNVLGTLNILETVRSILPDAIVIYSSTNKVYGDLEHLQYRETDSRYVVDQFPNGIAESFALDFRTPYGCSKGAADQYMLDYARSFDLRTIVFRHSSVFGGRQYSTFDQGWIGWFVQQALEKKHDNSKEPFTISGNGKQVRDVLHCEDIVSCYFSALDKIETTKGEAYNIGGGPENSMSLLELFDLLQEQLQVKLNYKELPRRTSDQLSFIADIRKASSHFGWQPLVDKTSGIERMINWVEQLLRTE